jgi:hypothetical protein
MARRTGRLIHCFAVNVLLNVTSAAQSQLLPPQSPQSKLLSYGRGVAQIAPQFVDGEPAPLGWGLIVGDSGDTLTIVTPCHVVWDESVCGREERPMSDTPEVHLEGISQPIRAHREPMRFPGDDVAILLAAKPASFVTIPLPVVDLHDVAPLMGVWMLGSPEGRELRGSGHYQKETPDGRLAISDLPAPPGSSGGLVLNDYGVVGMVLSESGLVGNTYVQSGGRIAELVDSAGFNANLLRSAPPPPPRPRRPEPLTLDDVKVGPEIGAPTLPVLPSEWQTVRSTSFPTPSSRTTLTLSGTSGAGGPATLDDTKLGHAEGTYKQVGWTIGFTSPTLCAGGEMYSDTRTGLNIVHFQMTPLTCSIGRTNCACDWSSSLTIHETLVQTGQYAPALRPDPLPPPADYRPPSDLSGETWAFTYGGHEIRIDFAADGTATFSSPAFGWTGQWTRNGRQYVTITTPSYTIVGTLSGASGSMAINVARQGSPESVASGLTMRRISDAAASEGPTPAHILPAPDMQPAIHLGGHKLLFDVGGPPLVVMFSPEPDRQVTLSNPRYGATGTWRPVGSVGFTVTTTSHGVIGWFIQNGNGEVTGCSATIKPLYRASPPGSVITCRSVDDR